MVIQKIKLIDYLDEGSSCERCAQEETARGEQGLRSTGANGPRPSRERTRRGEHDQLRNPGRERLAPQAIDQAAAVSQRRIDGQAGARRLYSSE